MTFAIDPPTDAQGRTLDVLVVDDNAINRDLFTRALGQLPGTAVTAVALASEALHHCRARGPDLVVLDYHLPGMDGMQCLEALRAEPGTRDVPVMLVTADADREVRYRALGLGADDFLAKPVDVFELRLRARNLLRLRVARRDAATRFERLVEARASVQAALDARDLETAMHFARMAEWRAGEGANHLPRVAHLSELVARGLGLPASMVPLVFAAAPLHDIGMLAVPQALVDAPGLLGDDAREAMHAHTTAGEAMLAQSGSAVLAMAGEIAGGHHEWFDGAGYPRGRSGERIPLAARIVAVADTLDAFTLPRPWRAARSVDQARAHLSSRAGTQFDPECVRVLLARWDDVLAIREAFPATEGYRDAWSAVAP